MPAGRAPHFIAVHPFSVYAPLSDVHTSAFGVPSYPAAHSPFVKPTAKFGASNFSDAMAYPVVGDGVVHVIAAHPLSVYGPAASHLLASAFEAV